MKRQNINLIQNYTDSDLQSFAILNNFKNYRSDLIGTKNKHNINQSVGYALSDNKHFQKLMNFNKNTKTSSAEYSIDDITDSEDLTKNKKHNDDNSFYNESDIHNFKNLKQIALAKSEIMNNIVSGGSIILNADDMFYKFHQKMALRKKLKVYSFSINKKNATVRLNSIKKEKTA